MTAKTRKVSSVAKGRQRTNVRRRGFYGCRGQLVRIELAQVPERYPSNLRIPCPECKHEHVVQPFWRQWSEKLDAATPAAVIER